MLAIRDAEKVDDNAKMVEEAVEQEEGQKEERRVGVELVKVFVGKDEKEGEEQNGRLGGGEKKEVKHDVIIIEVVTVQKREKKVWGEPGMGGREG